MIKDFEAWINESVTSTTTMLGRTFLASWINFYECFQAWKTGDSQKLVKDLVSHFMDLEKLWISVKDQEDAETEWMPSMKEQQKHVQSRLLQLGPAAMEALFNERSAARTDIINMASEEEMILPPRQVTMMNTSCDVYVAVAVPRRDSVTRGPRTNKTAEPTQQESIPAMNSIWNNQKLAHELIMDPDFKMKRSDASTLEGQVAAMARKAFFDSVREQLSQGKYEEVVPNLMMDIKDVSYNFCALRMKYSPRNRLSWPCSPRRVKLELKSRKYSTLSTSVSRSRTMLSTFRNVSSTLLKKCFNFVLLFSTLPFGLLLR